MKNKISIFATAVALLLTLAQTIRAQTFSSDYTTFTDPLTSSTDSYLSFSAGIGGSISYSGSGSTLTSANSSNPNSVGLNFNVTDPNTGDPASITGDFTASFNFTDVAPAGNAFNIGLTAGANIGEDYYYNGFFANLAAGVPNQFNQSTSVVTAGTLSISRVDGVVSYSFDGDVFGTENNNASVNYISLSLYQALPGTISATFNSFDVTGLPEITSAPEPGALALTGLGGLGGLIFLRRRK